MFRAGEIEAGFDALQAHIHLCLNSFPPQIVASYTVDVFPHPEELGHHVRQRCLDFRLSGLQLL